jgi:hypothetical protein
MSGQLISILVDPKLDIADLRVALKHSALEVVEIECNPRLYVIKPIRSAPTDETVRTTVLRDAGQ